MTFALHATDHTGITVGDLDRSLTFWCDVLGFTLERRGQLGGSFAADVVGVPGAEIRTAVVAVPGHRVELLEYDAPPHDARTGHGPEVPGSMHLAFRVDGLDVLLERIEAAGWSASGRVRTLDAGPRAGHRFVYVRDPDGTTLEFVEPPS